MLARLRADEMSYAARVRIAFLALLLPVCGCGISGLRRAEVQPNLVASVPHPKTALKAHLHDGSLLVFGEWSLAEHGTVVVGKARRLDSNRESGPLLEQRVVLDSVALFESDELTMPGPMAAITVVSAVHLGLTAYCIVNPKACFGSCPTFYAFDGEQQKLMAEGFSASVAPALEATDLDALDRARPLAGRLTLTMVNEALETHVVRHADLLAAPRPDGGRVLARADGELWSTTDWRSAAAATAEEGDCGALLASRDGMERSSPADSTDLAARETIELRFDHVPPGQLGLAIVARQSLLSTYVFYQALAWMGRSAGTWLASLERMDDSARARTISPAQAMGGIEVLVADGEQWVGAGGFHETGPLASDTRLVPLPVTAATLQVPVRVRLTLTRGLWRVDQVALVSIRGNVSAVRISPSRVLRRGVPDVAALASLTGRGGRLVTQPGDTLALVYELPATVGERPELFLESRGYYLEWMRDDWLAEEDPVRLSRLFLAPSASLREMAPAYKLVESGMERTFWGSRYAR